MNINDKNFCVVPFVQLNTRGKGDPRVCCSIDGLDYGIPKNLTLDEFNSNTYNNQTDVFNLANDSIEELWNSKFIKDFRIKMLTGEEISNCNFCHRMEASGLTSKRLGKNKRFLEKTKPFLEKYYKENGNVDIMPQWWEIRLSTKCNLSCIMCTPGLSSMMYKEYSKWERQNQLTPSMQGSLTLAKDSGEEYLSKSKYFKKQIHKNLQNVLFMEFRGGEVFADTDSINFIKEIAATEHAKNIQLDISTNATLINEEIIDVLNYFAGGTLRFSIDAYKEEDEYIRYHTNWDSVIKSMNCSRNLHKDWRFLTQTTVQMLNCLSMDKLISFFDKYIREDNSQRFFLGFTTVRGKDYLRHEMIPLELRLDQISKLNKLKNSLYIFTEHNLKDYHIQCVDMLIKTLQSKECNDAKLFYQAKSYFDKLSALRKKDYYSKFPHLKILKKKI